MDNFHIDIVSEGDMTEAMKIAFGRRKAEAYLVDEVAMTHREYGSVKKPRPRLTFFWIGTEDAHPKAVKLPFKLDHVGAADFARRWLAEQDYGIEPDHDGSNGRGWRIYNDSWGQVEGLGSYSFVAIQPAWALYGK